jgi:multiple antibiotic resistance protein
MPQKARHGVPEQTALVSLGAVFTLVFVMLGPVKVLGPFAQMTRELDAAARQRIALLAFALALAAAIAGGFVGVWLAENWTISIPSLLLAGGVVFFLVGLQLLLEQYHPAHAASPPLPPRAPAAAMRITFPTIVTPYGIATLIVLFANSHSVGRTAAIVAILIGVMVLNLLAMLYAHRIMSGAAVLALQVLGAVLGVLQLALAVEIILRALRELRVLNG